MQFHDPKITASPTLSHLLKQRTAITIEIIESPSYPRSITRHQPITEFRSKTVALIVVIGIAYIFKPENPPCLQIFTQLSTTLAKERSNKMIVPPGSGLTHTTLFHPYQLHRTRSPNHPHEKPCKAVIELMRRQKCLVAVLIDQGFKKFIAKPSRLRLEIALPFRCTKDMGPQSVSICQLFGCLHLFLRLLPHTVIHHCDIEINPVFQ